MTPCWDAETVSLSLPNLLRANLNDASVDKLGKTTPDCCRMHSRHRRCAAHRHPERTLCVVGPTKRHSKHQTALRAQPRQGSTADDALVSPPHFASAGLFASLRHLSPPVVKSRLAASCSVCECLQATVKHRVSVQALAVPVLLAGPLHWPQPVMVLAFIRNAKQK